MSFSHITPSIAYKYLLSEPITEFMHPRLSVHPVTLKHPHCMHQEGIDKMASLSSVFVQYKLQHGQSSFTATHQPTIINDSFWSFTICCTKKTCATLPPEKDKPNRLKSFAQASHLTGNCLIIMYWTLLFMSYIKPCRPTLVAYTNGREGVARCLSWSLKHA